MRSISSIQNSETSKLTQKPDFYLGQGFLLQILILNVMIWTNSVHGKSAPDNLWLNPVKRFAEIVSLCEVHLAKIALVMPSSSSTNLFKSTHMKFLANLTRVTMLKKYLMLSYQQSLVNFASENLNHYSPYRFFFKKKWANPGLFFVYFWSFQRNNTICATNQCEKCPSSMCRRDSNPRLFKHESSPITTRTGLQPYRLV